MKTKNTKHAETGNKPPRTLYILRLDEVCKIGITNNLKRRLAQYKFKFGYEPRVEFSVDLPYRCARCIESGLAWNFEYFDESIIDEMISCVKFAVQFSNENKCKNADKCHKWMSSRNFNKECGMKFTAWVHSQDYTPSVGVK